MTTFDRRMKKRIDRRSHANTEVTAGAFSLKADYSATNLARRST